MRSAPGPAIVLRALVVGFALLAAADLTLDAPAPRTRVVIVDQSRSLARGKGRVMALARAAIADLRPEDRVAVVRLGAEVTPLAPVPAQEADVALAAAVAAPADPRGTRIDLALRAALDVGGPGAEVVLVSDGRETGGDALAAATELAASGGRLVAAIPDVSPPLGLRVARLEVAARAPEGARLPVEVEVTTAAGDPRRVEVLLEVSSSSAAGPDGAIGVAAVVSMRATGQVGPGAPLVVRFTTPPLPARGSARLRARVVGSGPDDAPEDDSRAALVVTGGARRALVVAGDERDPVASALRAAGLTVEVVAPGGLAAALQGGAGPGAAPDLVVLSDVRWTLALAEGLPALTRAVDAGAGLAAVGCEAAFGPGGWAGTSLEELLPVRCGPGRERERPLAVAVALDASGSMQGVVPGTATTRWRQAVPAALSAADEGGALEEGDGLAVFVFAAASTQVRELAPLAPGALEALRTDLLERRPTGATDVAAGLLAALGALAPAPSGPDGQPPERLVILVTDAADARARDRAGDVKAARGRLGAVPLHVLVVVVGATLAEAAPIRALVAPLGDEARVEVAADADAELRKLVQGELSARRQSVRRGSFPVKLLAQAVARGVVWPGPVQLLATVRVRDEQDDGAAQAELLARAEDAAAGDPPLLVLGRRGAGRVLAAPVAPDVAASLVVGLAGELAPADSDGATLEARRAGDLVLVTVEGRDDGADLPPLLAVTARDAAGATTEGTLVGASRDRLRGALRAPSAGALDLVARAPGPGAGPGEGRVVARGQLPDLAVDECAGDGPDAARLALLCEVTGGRVVPALPAPASAWSSTPRGGERRLAPFAALAALAALLAETARAALSVRRAPTRHRQ